VGRIQYDGPIKAITGPDLGYRNRTQFHIEGRSIGYFVEGTHSLVPIDYCPISSPAVNRTLQALIEMAADRRWPGFLRSVEVFTNEEQVLLNVLESDRPLAKHFFDWCAERIAGYTASTIDYPAAGTTYRVGHRSFFQVNRFLVDALVDAAVADAAGAHAIDLYSGVGLFSIKLASRFGRVTAVESGRSAVRDLETNAERAGVTVGGVQDDVESFLAKVDTAPDFVLADPPRAGLGKRAVRELLRLSPQRIHIVACDPATLARDIAALTGEGYRIERLTMADLFPHTYHIETIAYLVR
jgi:23S rRNA (uracil1939-C5)-methyltransferase